MAKSKSYKSHYLRALADYQNFENRVNKEKEDLVKSASRRIITKILPLLDNIEKAEVFVKDQGLKLIKDDFLRVMREEGLEELEVLGKPFDPEYAEAVEIIDGDTDNRIIEVVRRGYKLNGKIIRPAQVKVSKLNK